MTLDFDLGSLLVFFILSEFFMPFYPNGMQFSRPKLGLGPKELRTLSKFCFGWLSVLSSWLDWAGNHDCCCHLRPALQGFHISCFWICFFYSLLRPILTFFRISVMSQSLKSPCRSQPRACRVMWPPGFSADDPENGDWIFCHQPGPNADERLPGNNGRPSSSLCGAKPLLPSAPVCSRLTRLHPELSLVIMTALVHVSDITLGVSPAHLDLYHHLPHDNYRSLTPANWYIHSLVQHTQLL